MGNDLNASRKVCHLLRCDNVKTDIKMVSFRGTEPLGSRMTNALRGNVLKNWKTDIKMVPFRGVEPLGPRMTNALRGNVLKKL